MKKTVGFTGWFEKKSPGVFKLTLQGSIGLAAGVALIIFFGGRANNMFVTISLIIALVVFELFYGWEHDGKTLARRGAEKRDLARRIRRGEEAYVTGAMSNLAGNEGAAPLPGMLASSKLLRGIDGYGQAFDVIHYPSKGLFAVSFRCEPDGNGTNDQDLIDHQVAKFGAWAATLSVEEGVVGASVIVDSASGTGVELRESVIGARADTAPEVASRVMDAIVEEMPNYSSHVVAYATVVWRKSGMMAAGGTAQDVVVEIAKRLPAHAASLEAGGAGNAVAMTEAELVEVAQVAYDPELATAFDLLRAREETVELDWAGAGPSFLLEQRGSVQLPGGVAETVEMRRPPRGMIFDNHLVRLLQPSPAFLRKRVAIYYQAVKADKAQNQAENAVRSEDFIAAQQKGRRTATTRRSIGLATQLDEEIARGAALVPFAMLATATYADDPESEARARNTMLGLMTASRMKVRRSKGLQAALFHMTLPFGLLPWEFSDNPFKR
ncbi:SCO6880 family protein [Microbacterium sp. NPDC055665]